MDTIKIRRSNVDSIEINAAKATKAEIKQRELDSLLFKLKKLKIAYKKSASIAKIASKRIEQVKRDIDKKKAQLKKLK